MRKIKNVILILVLMTLISVVCLLIVSVLTYIYKWKADKALIGITATYILTGLLGGFMLKVRNKEEKNMGRKMAEAMFLSIVYIGLLVVVSIFFLQIPFEFSSRFIMIWMLLAGSTCLGRIL